MKKEKIVVYRCNSLKAAQDLFDKFSKMDLENLDKERFFDLYNKGKSDIGFCVRFNTWQVTPLDGGNLFDATIIDI